MKIWAILPAAGIGQRMATAIPKQYLPLHGSTVIEHSLKLLGQLPVESIVVPINPADDHWPQLGSVKHMTKVVTVSGGAQRSDSVLNGLLSIDGAPEDLVLVHDAVRPCVEITDINQLIHEVRSDTKCKGGILAAPISDTIKRVDESLTIVETVARSALWSALTPQLFRYKELLEAMQMAAKKQRPITDEASALELVGHKIKVVAGNSQNIKITHPSDLALAELILKSRETRT